MMQRSTSARVNVASIRLPGMKVRRVRPEHPRLMTLKEWGELPDDVFGELVDGVLEEEEVTTRIHDAIAGYLFAFFWPWARLRGGVVFVPDAKYGVAPRRGRKPDLSVFFHAKAVRGSERVTTTPPDIAIEIITPTPRDQRRDRVDKRREYARFGIRWYWLVDPSLRTVEILELDSKRRYKFVADGSSGKLRVPGCRGLMLNLDELWSEPGRLAR